MVILQTILPRRITAYETEEVLYLRTALPRPRLEDNFISHVGFVHMASDRGRGQANLTSRPASNTTLNRTKPHICIHIHTNIHTNAYIHTHKHMSTTFIYTISIHLHTCIHTHKHTHTHTHTYMHTNTWATFTQYHTFTQYQFIYTIIAQFEVLLNLMMILLNIYMYII